MSRRLLIVSPTTDRGGAEGYLLTVARAAVEAGWGVTVSLQSSPRTCEFVRQLLRVCGVRYIDAAIAGDRRRRGVARQAYETARLLARVRPSAVMTVLPWPDLGLGCMFATAFARVPAAVVFQLAPWPVDVGRRDALYRWAQRRGEQWVAVSTQNRAAVAGSFNVPPCSIRVIYNGVPAPAPTDPARVETWRRALRDELDVSVDARLVITVGRLHPQKGHSDLLGVLPRVLEQRPDVFFLWAGDGELRAELESEIRRLGLDRRVRVLGYRPDVTRLLEASDLFLFPSRFEGHPFALLEAMAAGIPAISSDAGGSAEIMRDDVDGLVHRREDPADIASHLGWALDHPAEMRRMAVSARKRSRNFSEANMLLETLALLDGLCPP